MAHLLDETKWERLRALADALLEGAREQTRGETIIPIGASPEQAAVYDEATALTVAIEALIKGAPLDEAPTFIAIGAAVGTVLAQSFANHAELLHHERAQMEQTYNEVRAVSKPRGRMQ